MSKVIARFLVASAFCLMPVLTSAQDAAVPVGVGETLQAQPVLDRPEIIADSASSDRGPYGELAWAPLLDDLDAIVAAEAADDSQAAGVDLAVADAFDTDSVAGDELGQAPLMSAAADDLLSPMLPILADDAVPIEPGITDMANMHQMMSKLDNMMGKEVLDQNAQLMGTIIGVNDETSVAEIELISGRIIAVMPELLTDMGNSLVAADLKNADIFVNMDPSDIQSYSP